MSPVISCIVPVFNGERFLAEALESIFAQTYREIDVLVVDLVHTRLFDPPVYPADMNVFWTASRPAAVAGGGVVRRDRWYHRPGRDLVS